MIKSEDFFERPRSWSLTKYKILDKYLSQYFPKVNQQYRSPAFVADLFAGRGKFEDGSDGSPVICARHAQIYEQTLGYKNKVILSEIDEDDRKALIENLNEYIKNEVVVVIPGAAVDVGRFLLSVIPESTPLFMFLDPFGIKGLSMKLLIQVFERANTASTELLINFNYKALKRLAGVCRNLGSNDPTMKKRALLTKSAVDEALSGEWWLEVMNSNRMSDDDKLDSILNKYLGFFRGVFKWIGVHPVTTFREKEVKYFLIFASQSQVAIELMNDITIQAKNEVRLDEIREENVGTLFQGVSPGQFTRCTTEEDIQKLSDAIFKVAEELAYRKPGPAGNPNNVVLVRPQLRASFLQQYFARFTISQYNKTIKRLLVNGKFTAESGRSRISDQERIRITGI